MNSWCVRVPTELLQIAAEKLRLLGYEVANYFGTPHILVSRDRYQNVVKMALEPMSDVARSVDEAFSLDRLWDDDFPRPEKKDEEYVPIRCDSCGSKIGSICKDYYCTSLLCGGCGVMGAPKKTIKEEMEAKLGARQWTLSSYPPIEILIDILERRLP